MEIGYIRVIRSIFAFSSPTLPKSLHDIDERFSAACNIQSYFKILNPVILLYYKERYNNFAPNVCIHRINRDLYISTIYVAINKVASCMFNVGFVVYIEV